MNHSNWKPGWVRGGKLEEIVWIGKDVLAWCSGVHIMFLDIIKNKQGMYWCWNHDTGEGARCLSGHNSFSIFAFAERIIHPKILIYFYPSMTKISECTGGSPSGYVATAFTAGDYLISVGSYPTFQMIIWNWRTGTKLGNVNTNIRDEVGQILRVTQLGPSIVAQLGKTCGKLFTWDLNIAGKVVIMKDHEVKLPRNIPILWVDWCPTSREPLLALTDIDGHIFLSNHDGTEIHRIVLSQRCGVCTEVELPAISWFRNGIILRTTFCQIRFFTRNLRTNSWRREWYVKSTKRPYILVIHPFRDDRFFYYTLEGYLMMLDFCETTNNPRISNYLNYGSIYRFMDFVYPWCHHLVVTSDRKELAVLECYEGTQVSTFDLEMEAEILCQASHPDFPLIVLGTEDGELISISLVEPKEPKLVARVRLQRSPMNLIKFSNSGRSLVAVEKSTGNCYYVNLQRENSYTVQCLIKARRTVADLLVFDGYKRLRILVLFVSKKQYIVGQQLHLFEVSENQKLVTDFIGVLNLPGLFHTLWHVPGNPMLFVGSPYLTRQLRVLKVQDFKNVALDDGVPTGHQVKLANLFVDRSWITTTALDGLVLVRDKTVRRTMAHIMTHHRSDCGSLKALANRQGDFIVCLGYNGSMILTKTISDRKDYPESPRESASVPLRIFKLEHGLYEKYRKRIASDYASLDPTIYEMLTRPVYQFPDPEDGDKTWSEWREEMQMQEEEEKCRNEKAEILKDFEVLRGNVKKLLDANEVSLEIEKLPVSAFDLDTKGRDQKLKAGRDVCENLRLELEHNIFENTRVTKWIRRTFWDPQTILGKCLYAIFDSLKVANYPAVAPEPDTMDYLNWANFCKKTASDILEGDTFEPWKWYTEEELQVELNKKVKLHRDDERRIDLLFDEDEVEGQEVVEVEIMEFTALDGTSTDRFVEASSYYPQMGYYGFHQVMINNRLLMYDSEKLRAYFNQSFNEVYALKEREMNVIRERIDRIRYIDSELRIMFGWNVPHIPTDPEWHWEEQPESVVEVKDHEVKAKQYVSPSQQELLDKQAAEEERIRLLLLADDFRERALMAMMDGVLEIRWEDTIKIDIPKPACMLQKKPDDYTKEDIIVVKQYEKDVQFLMEERERYKRMLEAEYGKVMGLLKEGIDKFNGKLDELFHLKLDIEAAIHQLNLRYVRGWLLLRQRMKSLQREDELKKKIENKKQDEAVLNNYVQSFRNVHQEMVSKCTVWMNRDKHMGKRFRIEFGALNKLQNELLERQYNRRPRTSLKNLEVSDFFELAHHVASRNVPLYLPSECKDYLRILNNLDIRPTTLPPTIDNSQWEHLVRVRRIKIETELKIRGKQKEIANVEDEIMGFEHKIEKCNNEIEDMKNDLIDMRRRRYIEELDVEVQLVLKMGQVEINLQGDVTDAENAIFVRMTEIENVNKLIRTAGEGKLKSLSRLLSFQRGTIMMEWRHECRKKRLEDLKEDLRFLESVIVTKEMQFYLKRKARGLPDDKTPQKLIEDIAAINKQFQDIVDMHKARLETIQKDIASVESKNEHLDRQIVEMNVARCDMEHQRDIVGEERQREHEEIKLKMVMRRSELIKKLQDTYAEMLELQTEHELLRLKRYPTFHFKTLDSDEEEEEEREGWNKKKKKKKKKKDDTRTCPC